MDNANVNSVSGSDSDWKTSAESGLLTDRKEIGMNLNIQEKDRKWTEKLSTNGGWKKESVLEEQLRHEYTSFEDITQTLLSANTNREKFFNVSNNFTLSKPFRLRTVTNLVYSSADNGGHFRNISSRNIENRIYTSDNDNLEVTGLVGYMTKMPTDDELSLQIDDKYSKKEPNRRKSNDSIRYSLIDSLYTRDAILENGSRGYEYTLTGHYIMRFQNHIFLFGKLIYNQHYHNFHNTYSCDGILDAFNTNSYGSLFRKYSAVCGLSYYNETAKGMVNMSLTFPLHYTDENIDYNSLQLSKSAGRHYTNFLPNLYAEFSRNGFRLSGTASIGVIPPNIAEIVPVINTFDHLHIYKSNPLLNNSIVSSANISVGRTNYDNGQSWSVALHASSTNGAIGRRIVYSTQTGQYTFQNDNVNELNYDYGAEFNYHFDWGKNKMFSSTFDTDYSLVHNVVMKYDMTIRRTL